MALINCTPPITYEVPGCIDELIINTDLVASTTYSILFEFQNGFKLKDTVTLEADSSVILTKDNYLLGFWNEGTGIVNITISTFIVMINFTNMQTNDTSITVG